VFSRGRNGGDACKIKNQEMGRENAKEFRKRIVKMRRMNPQAPDFIQRNYLSFY
jgi:hypothetical protein